MFDGIGVFPLAARNVGIKTIWSSEIDKNAISISKRHFPKVEQLGDITKLKARDIKPVDYDCNKKANNIAKSEIGRAHV